jgi:hypothetical protein
VLPSLFGAPFSKIMILVWKPLENPVWLTMPSSTRVSLACLAPVFVP